jgi:uncharacterized membrane protein YhaH (DUF805 family)
MLGLLLTSMGERQMSFIFQRFDGRMSNWDYFVGLFKVLAVFGLGTKILPLMLANFQSRSDGFETFFSLFPVASAIMTVVVTWPLLAMINRRKNDLTDTMRTRMGMYAILLPVGVALIPVAQILKASGLPAGDFLDIMQAFTPIILIGTLILGILPSQGGTNRYGPDPRLERGKVPTPAAKVDASGIEYNKPLSQSVPKLPRGAANTPLAGAPARGPMTTAKSPIERTRKLPVDGRVKPGWFS